jgi:AraC-like DNA-binding protein
MCAPAFEPYSNDQMDYSSLQPFRHQSGNGWLHDLGPVTAQRFHELLHTLRQQLQTQPDGFWPCRSRSYLIELLFMLVQVYLSETPESDRERPAMLNEPAQQVAFPIPAESEDIYPLLVYLFNNYNKKITITDLTKSFNTNRNTLSQKFKRATGTTVIDYVSKLRVRMACQLLKDTSFPIAEISDHAGYVDLTHFGRTFRKYTHLTPSEYRARYQGEVSLAQHTEN